MISKYRTVFQNAGCFVAGTLVHTKDGLKPIEQIKVGDYVLSQPEMKGEKAYKRVSRTFEYDDKEVWIVRYQRIVLSDDLQEYNCSETKESLLVTPNHPFWLKSNLSKFFENPSLQDVGWTRADHLSSEDIIELADGSKAEVIATRQLYTTTQKNVFWGVKIDGCDTYEDSGNLVYINDGGIEVDNLRTNYNNAHLTNNLVWPEGAIVKSKVYNLEVEGFHTYYVGESGVWVHNQNCENNQWGLKSMGSVSIDL